MASVGTNVKSEMPEQTETSDQEKHILDDLQKINPKDAEEKEAHDEAEVDFALMESFPASDSPSWTRGVRTEGNKEKKD